MLKRTIRGEFLYDDFKRAEENNEKIKEKKRLPIRLTNENKACIIHIEFLNRYRDAAKI